MTHTEARSPSERLAYGRKQRGRFSRVHLREVAVRTRGFDPVSVLLQAGRGRLRKLLPLKYQRMAASPFAFFRGAVALMASDLAGGNNTGLTVQLCGDAHVQNLGSFEGPDGRAIFDINDFDESTPGPWEWDVKRMAVSIVLAGFECGHKRAGCAAAAEEFASSYCALTEALAEQPVLTAARHQIHRQDQAQAVSAAFAQAARANPCDLLAKYTERNAKGQVRFRKTANTLWRLGGAQRDLVLQSLAEYGQSLAPERQHLFQFFRPLDVAFKVVGTGSVGLRNYVVLMEGNGANDTLFLQIKQEVESAYAPYLRNHEYPNQGRRVADAQRMLQPLSDLLLGWTRIGSQHFLVRQLNDHKGSVDIQQLQGEGLRSLASVAGELLARGHARSGDALAVKGYIGGPEKVVRSLVHYALEYAAVVHADFARFQKAIEGGRVPVAQSGRPN